MDLEELVQEAATSIAPIEKRAITNLNVLNEACDYARPSTFLRGMHIDIGDILSFLISGAAGIDEQGVSVHIGDFRSQCWHISEHHRAAQSPRRDLTLCDQLLPAEH